MKWAQMKKKSQYGGSGRTVQGESVTIMGVTSRGSTLAEICSLQLLSCLSLSGRAGPLPIKGNKLLGSLWYRSNPQGVLLQANGSEQKEKWGRFGPTPFGVGVHPPWRDAPDRYSPLIDVVFSDVLKAAATCSQY